MSIRYIGSRPDGRHAEVIREENGKAEPLPLRLDLANKSPSGFEWGYSGSGPAQLALAILVDAIGETRGKFARLYQNFKHEIVGRFDYTGFSLTRDQVIDWLNEHQEELAWVDEQIKQEAEILAFEEQ